MGIFGNYKNRPCTELDPWKKKSSTKFSLIYVFDWLIYFVYFVEIKQKLISGSIKESFVKICNFLFLLILILHFFFLFSNLFFVHIYLYRQNVLCLTSTFLFLCIKKINHFDNKKKKSRLLGRVSLCCFDYIIRQRVILFSFFILFWIWKSNGVVTKT